MNAKQRIEEDVQRFAESLQFFNKSASIYSSAGTAIKGLHEAKQGMFACPPSCLHACTPATQRTQPVLEGNYK